MEFWFSEFHTPDVKHSIRVNKQLYSKQSVPNITCAVSTVPTGKPGLPPNAVNSVATSSLSQTAGRFVRQYAG